MANFYKDLVLHQAYNFTLKAAAVLGTGYDGAMVTGILDYDTAKTVMDVASLHRAALPNLGAGTQINPKDLIYIKIKTLAGEYRIIADVWLSSKPVLATSNRIVVTIEEVSVNDIALINNLLRSRGISNFKIDIM